MGEKVGRLSALHLTAGWTAERNMYSVALLIVTSILVAGVCAAGAAARVRLRHAERERALMRRHLRRIGLAGE